MSEELKATSLVASLRRLMANKVISKLILKLSKPKSIERVLAIYAGLQEATSIREAIASKVIAKALAKSAAKFGVEEEALKSGLKDPYIRRALANIMLGIAYYGVTKPQKLYAPFMVVWDFTLQCNLRCKHCYANAGRSPPPDELTLSEKLEVLKQLDEAGVAALSFSGGEPLISKDFWAVAEAAAKAGMYVSVATNGTLISEHVAARLKEVGVRYVEVSIDSPYPELHDSFRGVKGAWEAAVRGVRNLKKVGLSVGIATTVTKLNYKDIPEMIRLARELGADKFAAFNFIPVGRGRDLVKLDLSPQERVELLEYLYSEWSRGGLQVFSTSPFYAVVSLKHVNEQHRISPTHFAELIIPEEYAHAGYVLAEFLGGCGAGRIYCSIEHNGDVQPCVFLPIRVGNVLRDGFLKIWHESPILNLLRDRDRCACGGCPYKYICGGCRARAYAYFGDLMGPDPSCPYNEKYWEELVQGGSHESVAHLTAK